MSDTFDEQQVLAWLQLLFGDCKGYINIVSTNNWAGRSFDTPEAATAYVKQLDRQKPKGIYARITTLRQPLEEGRGSVEDSAEFVGFWADLDINGPGHKTRKPLPRSIEDCLEIIEVSGLPAPTEWVHSGGGMYPFWLLTTPVTITDEDVLGGVSDISAQWQRVIELASEARGFSYGAGVGDLARVLRIPGTVNRKVDDEPVSAEWRMDLSESTPYTYFELVRAMKKSLKALEPPKVEPQLAPTPPKPSVQQQGERVGDAFNNATTWKQLLEADGAVIETERGFYIEWVRPGKDRRDGMSATTGYGGGDVLKVFTDAWDGLEQGRTYDRFGYYAATRHNGNISAATRDLGGQGYGDRTAARSGNHTPAEAWNYQPVEPASGAADASGASGDAPGDTTGPVAPRSASRKPTYTYTESGFADRLQARHGDVWRHFGVDRGSTWLKWDGKLWQEDEKGTVINLVDGLLAEEFERLDAVEDPKEREAVERSLRAMMSNAKQVGASKIFARRPGIAVTPEELNAHQYKMTTGNGVFDLETMTFGPHNRDLLATKKLGVDFDAAATAPRWEKFLEDVLPDPEMRDYLQRGVGYTLTGDTDRKAMFMIHGVSNCGKSQVINAIAAVFGDFAAAADYSAFEQRDNNGNANPGLHKLQGARFVHCSETAEGTRLNETLIKRITGGDEIVSRTLYSRDETWKPQFSIFIATNHLPRLSSDDDAIWRRVKPIHLPVVFGTSDRPETLDIGRKLAAAEGPGILNWMLEGLKKYREHGLAEPSALKKGVAAYQADSDPVARFLSHGATEGGLVLGDDDEKIESRTLYSQFTMWCAEEGIRSPLTANRFGRRMTALGYESARDSTGTKRVWRGVGQGKDTWLIAGHPIHS